MSAIQTSWYGSSKTEEWYTEAHVIDLVIKVLGVIDLDPCSNPAPYNVPAATHYTRDEGGLTPPWAGRVFLNPPYGRELPRWMGKLADEIRRGRVREAITLTPARTDTRWFGVLWQADALCFWFNRMYFLNGSDGRAPFPSVLGYFGPQRERFATVFGDAGKIICPNGGAA